MFSRFASRVVLVVLALGLGGVVLATSPAAAAPAVSPAAAEQVGSGEARPTCLRYARGMAFLVRREGPAPLRSALDGLPPEASELEYYVTMPRGEWEKVHDLLIAGANTHAVFEVLYANLCRD